MQYVYQNGYLRRQSGQVPVLLVMDRNYTSGSYKAFLHDSRSSAFPNEKEYLLGFTIWHVTQVSEETLEYKSHKFKGTVIGLKTDW